MSTQNINLPAFPQTFSTQAALPAVGFDGQLAVVLLDHSLWVFDVGTLTWSMVTGGGGGGGTVLSVSVVSAHGLAGTVANPTTTPAISLSTTVTGVLKGDGTSISAGVSGTDYSAGTSALATGILKSTTTTGVLSIAVPGDFPTLNQNTSGTASNVTGVVAIANGGTGQITAPNAVNALLGVGVTAGDFLGWNGSNWVEVTPSTSAGTPVTIWYDPTSSGVSTYKELLKASSAAAEQDNSVAITAATSPQTIQTFVTTTPIGVTTIPGGEWGFDSYANVSSNTGTTNLQYVVKARTVGGSETTLFTTTSALVLTGTTTTLYSDSTFQPAFTVNTDDVIVVVVQAVATGVTSRTAHFIYSGSTHASHIHTPFTFLHNDLGGQQGGNTTQRYHLTQANHDLVGSATDANTASTLVKRDASGNFSAGTINASLSGNATNVTGTVAIANGGTGQTTKAPAFDALSPMTTGGDLIYGGASGTGTRLANGSAGNVLISAGGTSAPTWGVGGTVAATASTLMARDSNANSKINNIAENLATTATAAGTTTLTVSSSHTQQFTGTSTQTVVLPDATTLSVGHSFNITNRSTGIVTVNANGGGLIQTMVGGSQAVITAVTVGTSAGTWDSQYSVSGIVAAIQPTVQKFTSGSGTYTTPAGVQWIEVEMVGGGGGSGGSGTAGGGTGGTGANTTFGSSLLVANGGVGGAWGGNGGVGGTASLGSGPIGVALSGGQGGGAQLNVAAGNLSAMPGACSPFGGAGSNGVAAIANTGSGGTGASVSTTAAYTGGGGGAGGYVKAIITSPAATYAYSVAVQDATHGQGGTAGTSGAVGGAGASGQIVVREYYTNFSVGTTTSVAANTFLAGPTGGANANPTFRALTAPTIQKFTSGSGTYTTPTNPAPLYIEVELVGGGGGGGGSATTVAADGGAGGTGGVTTFGSSLLTANGGVGGTSGNSGGAGGTASLGAAIGLAISGGSGSGGTQAGALSIVGSGGCGAASPFGGQGGGAGNSAAGLSAIANTGSGGGGASGPTSGRLGGGGGAGGYVKAIITSPAATYAYSVAVQDATHGQGGTAGTGGVAGGAGGSGVIIVREHYQ